MTIIAITNQKGGVGKTTIAFNLAKGLAARGYKTIAIDNDPQGNLTGALLEDPTSLTANILQLYEEDHANIYPQPIQENLDLIGANIHLSRIADKDFEVIFKLKEGLEGVGETYEFVLIDCLPSFGYLNMAALNVAGWVLIPIQPAPFALAGLKDLFDTISKARKRLNKDLEVLGIVLNLMEGRRTTIEAELEGILREKYRALIFHSILNKGIKLAESPSFTQSIMEYDPQSKPALQFEDFINEFLQRIRPR